MMPKGRSVRLQIELDRRQVARILERRHANEGLVAGTIGGILRCGGHDVTDVKWWYEPSAGKFYVVVEIKVYVGQEVIPKYVAEVVGVMLVFQGYHVKGVKWRQARERRAGLTTAKLPARPKVIEVPSPISGLHEWVRAREREGSIGTSTIVTKRVPKPPKDDEVPKKEE